MGKKDSKKKSAEKKARVAEKTARKTSKKEKKSSNKEVADVDDGEVDLDSVLEEYARQQALFLKVTETTLTEPPPVRANATLAAAPSGKELFLFGGETFNGAVAKFFNELFVYNPAHDEWRQITSPNSPLPRSGHCVTTSQYGGGGSMWLFGGEFSSPKQGTFYHYNDFWRFDIGSREWSRVEGKGGGKGGSGGGGPPARSGHRMVAWKNYILVMGGFQDTSSATKYLSDLWAFDTSLYTWTVISLPAHAQRPEARSSFSLLPHEQGAVLFGGYSRVKSSSVPSAGNKKGGGSKASSGSVAWKPVIHQDTWFLRMDRDLTKVRWERRKKPGNPPNPPRVGVTMAWHKGRGILFGGVKDEEDSDEGLESTFFNDLFAWGIDRNRFFPLVLRKSRVQKKTGNERGGGRRDRAREAEEDLLRNLKALEAVGKDGDCKEEEEEEEEEGEKKEEKRPVVIQEQVMSLELPHERFNAALAVLDDVLYIYGGTWEKGDREFTFDEMFAIDLGRLDGVRSIFSRKDETIWEESEDEEDEEDDDDEEEEEEEEEMEIDENEGPKKVRIDDAEIELRRKEKAQEEAVEEASLDRTPHPRPFESLREFFARTSVAWLEILIAEQETGAHKNKTVKELRKEGFAIAEEKWWACREEIRALEDEQEEAGIGEVVSLADAGGSGGGAGRRR
ncbi:galactose oxidase [Tuber magnatum]|uniref:Galactose oxidase n=1 Tax=Tuber magnatum TaxID=42249 RepID=A0A317SQ64_9PEZI|nr:galactose oxidase [Tuber magnatum]